MKTSTQIMIDLRLQWPLQLSPAHAIPGDNERVIELPLAVDVLGLHRPGLVLDAGCALLPFMLALPPTVATAARVMHLTQNIGTEPIIAKGEQLSYVSADLRNLSMFADRAFDAVGCISTLEHVGMDNAVYGAAVEADPDSKWTALRELIRVTKQTLFLTVPFREQAIENPKWTYFTRTMLAQMTDLLTPLGSIERAFYGRLSGDRWYGGSPVPLEGLDEIDPFAHVAQIMCMKWTRA